MVVNRLSSDQGDAVFDDSRGGAGSGDQADDVLLAELADLLGRVDPPPPWLVDLAKLSYDLRSIDVELADLVADSSMQDSLVGVRAATMVGPRMLTFERGDWLLEVEASRTDSGWQLLGQVVPSALCRIEIVQRAGGRVVESDDLGRFVVPDVLPEPVMLIVEAPGTPRIGTGWFGVGST